MTAFEEDTIQVDAYLDGLLASRNPAAPRPLTLAGEDLFDPDLAVAAGLVQRTLARFHPSFRFEERLARTLRDDAGRTPGFPIGGSSAVTEPIVIAAFAGAGAAVGSGPLVDGPGRRIDATGRSIESSGLDLRGRGGLLLGGAIASGVSIAGAAVLAWRRARAEHRWERLA